MKLAEALQERADLNRKIEELRRRLANVILVQEGEEPAEEPAELLKELNAAIARLEQLMAAINLTNCRTKANGMTLTALWLAVDLAGPAYRVTVPAVIYLAAMREIYRYRRHHDAESMAA